MIVDHIYKKYKSEAEIGGKSESHSRSFLKALSWRFVGTMDTVTVAWVISGTWDIAFYIGTFELLTKTILYYFHERMWNTIKWGK